MNTMYSSSSAEAKGCKRFEQKKCYFTPARVQNSFCQCKSSHSVTIRVISNMLFASLSVFVAALCAAATADPTVTLPDGTQLLGKMEGNVAAYRGIRFAQPPLGNLRWAPPTPWVNTNINEVYDATNFGHTCRQALWGDDGLFTDGGEEDCLFLNVYVNQNATVDSATQPVGIFVHGGSYVSGAGSLPLYDGVDVVEFWKGKAIMVTTNYRLNVFGFLGSDELRSQDKESASTGNYGMCRVVFS
jgi:para-nitrobenzyl esterase